jgi:hypothetical protein
MAAAFGVRLLASASGKDGVALALRLGAGDAVEGRRGDIVAAARRFAPDGIDTALGLACVRGALFALIRCRSCGLEE